MSTRFTGPNAEIMLPGPTAFGGLLGGSVDVRPMRHMRAAKFAVHGRTSQVIEFMKDAISRRHDAQASVIKVLWRIPVRQARSDTRGRPPCCFGAEAGRSGPIKLHRASETSSAAITIPPSR